MDTNGIPEAAPSARAIVIECLDRVLARPENRERLTAAFQAALQKEDCRFFKTIVLPLILKPSAVGGAAFRARRGPGWVRLLPREAYPPDSAPTAQSELPLGL